MSTQICNPLYLWWLGVLSSILSLLIYTYWYFCQLCTSSHFICWLMYRCQTNQTWILVVTRTFISPCIFVDFEYLCPDIFFDLKLLSLGVIIKDSISFPSYYVKFRNVEFIDFLFFLQLILIIIIEASVLYFSPREYFFF